MVESKLKLTAMNIIQVDEGPNLYINGRCANPLDTELSTIQEKIDRHRGYVESGNLNLKELPMHGIEVTGHVDIKVVETFNGKTLYLPV